MLQTYLTKIKTDDTTLLDEVASLFGLIERRLFVDAFIHKKNRNECKKDYLLQYKITARQYNSIYMILQGKVDSIKERNKFMMGEIKEKIKSIEYDLMKKEKQKGILHEKLTSNKNKPKLIKTYKNLKFTIHHKKRKLYRLKLKLNQLKEDEKRGILRICFGSKKLFHQQFHLEENNYKNHEEWKTNWIKSRSSSFYCIGSKDETCGNQNCSYNPWSILSCKCSLRHSETRIRFKN